MMRQVPVSVVMAGAALEASANELLQLIIDAPAQFSLKASRKVLLVDLKDDHSGNAVHKYRRLSLLMDHEPDTGSETWNNARLLVKLRNEFMHFRPAWDDDGIHTVGFVEDLKRKIQIVDSWKGQLLFPHGFMTYGCAKWAVQTVLAFSADFSKLLGVRDQFISPGLEFNLP